MSDNPRLSIIVTCMGRLDQLRRSIPPLLAQGAAVEIILVDWSCPDFAAAHACEHWPGVRVVEVPDQVYFHKSAALNAGIRVARAPWIVIFDADMIASADLVRELTDRLRPGVLLGLADERLAGFVACSREAFNRTGGYDERMRGWGYEDDDMRRRLLAQGLRLERLPASAVDVIPHDDALRTRFYAEKDRRHSALFNQSLVWQERWTEPAMRPEQWSAQPLLLPSGAGVGPVFRAVQFALHLQWRVGVPGVRLSSAAASMDQGEAFGSVDRMMRDALDAIECPGPVAVVRGNTGGPGVELPFGAWSFPYFPMRTPWKGWPEARAHGRIMVGRIDDHEMEQLRHAVPSFAITRLEAGTSISAAAGILAESDAFVDRGGGFVHVASAVGVPSFLLADAELPTIVREDIDLEVIVARTLPDLLREVATLFGAAH